MEQFRLLSGIYIKQLHVIEKLYGQIRNLDLDNEDKCYVFSLKAQQLFTAVEDLLKNTAKSFENHLDDSSKYHIELLRRMATDIDGIRPAVLSGPSLKVLDKLRSFRHFIRHAYDYDLDTEELKLLQDRLDKNFKNVIGDLNRFKTFLDELAR